MGAWGVGLYQDDVTCDIKEEYLDRLRIGYSNIDATKEVIEKNLCSIEDEEDGPLFWFALADIQWKYGRLLPEIKDIAIQYINQGTDLERWVENKNLYAKRKQVLDTLKERLNSPQPPEKKIQRLVIHKATWKVGDVLLYQIKNEEFKDNKWYHKYVIFKVIGITKTNIGSLPREYSDEQNIVGLCNWVGDSIPDLDKIKKMDFIQENKLGRSKDLLRIFTFTRKELKKLDFKVVMTDETFFKNSWDTMSCLGIWPSINTLDWNILPALEEAEKNGILIDETYNEKRNID